MKVIEYLKKFFSNMAFMFRRTWKYAKSKYFLMILDSVKSTVQPFVLLIIPKYILDELASERRVDVTLRYIAYYAAAVVGFNLISLIISRFGSDQSMKIDHRVAMYLTAANTFSGAIMGVATNYSYLMLETTWYIKDYRRCLDLVKKQREEGGKTHIGVPANAKIEFRDVSFKYPDTDNIVLSHVNITIEAGEALSVVGINGSGKTTFVKLLCRLYEPTEGDIFINGVNSKDIPLTEYYRLLGVVFQDFSLFNFTVGENITMSTEHDEERLRESIKKSGLESRIETLPHGTDTYMFKEFEPDGIELSGGEGQKVAIARAIYKEAPIVVFDEPTSALDPIAEYNIYRNFHDLAEQRTAIYISHRLSSTRFTDRTAVFANNTIAEYGTHDELMRIEDGIYRKLFLMQAQYYRE